MREYKFTIEAEVSAPKDVSHWCEIIINAPTSQKALEKAKSIFQADSYQIMRIEE